MLTGTKMIGILIKIKVWRKELLFQLTWKKMLYNKEQVIFKDLLALLTWFMNKYSCHFTENRTILHKMHTLEFPKICSACMLNPHNLRKSHTFSNILRCVYLPLFLSVCHHHKAHRNNGSPQNCLLQTWKQFRPPGKVSNAVHKPRQALSSSIINCYYTLQHLDSTVIYSVYVSCMELCKLRNIALRNRQKGRESSYLSFYTLLWIFPIVFVKSLRWCDMVHTCKVKHMQRYLQEQALANSSIYFCLFLSLIFPLWYLLFTQ